MSMVPLAGAGRLIRRILAVLSWPFRRLARRLLRPFYLRFKARFYEDMTTKIDQSAEKWERRLDAFVCDQRATARRLAVLEDHLESLLRRQNAEYVTTAVRFPSAANGPDAIARKAS